MLTVGALRSAVTDASFRILAHQPRRSDLEQLAADVVAGAIRPVVDRTHPLARVGDALRRVGEGRALGKVVVSVRDA